MARKSHASDLFLAVELTDGTTERIRISDAATVRIGRDASCNVVLPSPDVSRVHAVLERAPGGLRLTDKSANGTFVGEPEKHLAGTTVIIAEEVPFRVGPYRMRVLSAARASEPTAAAPPAEARTNPSKMRMPGGLGEARPTSPPPADSRLAPMAPKPVGARARGGLHDVGPVDDALSGTVAPVAVRRKIHRLLLDHLDLASLDRSRMADASMRPKVRDALNRICAEVRTELPASLDVARLVDELTDEALGLGPLESLLSDESVTEIMVVDPQTIFIERGGRLLLTGQRFTDDDAVRAVIERIVTPLGRRIDESTPLVDARLKDGSRVNAVIPPLALRGPCITIRKFAKTKLSLDDLIRMGSLTPTMARFLTRCVLTKKNIVIAGGTGSGKTTLLNILSAAIPPEERIVTIEDAAELQLGQPHIVSLEARPPNMEGRGAITIRDLVKNALRMRPDRIVVGECRGGEALDMLQAMNTGHEGSMTTTHANSPPEALARLETLALMAGVDLPARAIREQIASSIHIIVQQSRLGDGARRVTCITEVTGLEPNGDFETRAIFEWHRTGTGAAGEVLGEVRRTGYLPSFLPEFIANGLVKDGEYL